MIYVDLHCQSGWLPRVVFSFVAVCSFAFIINMEKKGKKWCIIPLSLPSLAPCRKQPFISPFFSPGLACVLAPSHRRIVHGWRFYRYIFNLIKLSLVSCLLCFYLSSFHIYIYICNSWDAQWWKKRKNEIKQHPPGRWYAGIGSKYTKYLESRILDLTESTICGNKSVTEGRVNRWLAKLLLHTWAELSWAWCVRSACDLCC